MINQAEITGLNSMVQVIEAECDRLPEPYGQVLKGALSLLLPLGVAFVVKKFSKADAAAPAAVAAPVADAPVAG